MIIGITGRSGSGKSFLSDILAEKLDMIHIDIDKISHEVLTFEESKKFLLNEFGSEIFENGVVNRKKLGKIVFGEPEKLEKLNRFCQIEMEAKIDEIIASATKPLILDYALLFGLKQFESCDIKILLKADFDVRYSRVKTRENITREYFLSRDSSLSDSDYNESLFDFVYHHISKEEIEELSKTLKSKLGANHD